jgi:hypothetical protein
VNEIPPGRAISAGSEQPDMLARDKGQHIVSPESEREELEEVLVGRGVSVGTRAFSALMEGRKVSFGSHGTNIEPATDLQRHWEPPSNGILKSDGLLVPWLIYRPIDVILDPLFTFVYLLSKKAVASLSGLTQFADSLSVSDGSEATAVN